MEKEITKNTIPPFARSLNGVQSRAKEILLRLINKYREEYIVENDNLLEFPCKICGKVHTFPTEEDIPSEDFLCDGEFEGEVCGYKVIDYTGYEDKVKL